jgi:hypothetical protein
MLTERSASDSGVIFGTFLVSGCTYSRLSVTRYTAYSLRLRVL